MGSEREVEVNAKDLKYLKPIEKIHEILDNVDGVNYACILADAVPHDDESTGVFGGQLVHICRYNGMNTSPGIQELMGNLIVSSINAIDDMSYIDKMEFINDLFNNVHRQLLDGNEPRNFKLKREED